jgi:1,4-alpha-glucan branching enzyme
MKKAYSKTGRFCRVTFEMKPETRAQTVFLCGEFNGWNPTAHPMKRWQDGSFALTLSLLAGQQYRFRYLLDSERWANDPGADADVPNPFGSKDSMIQV